MPATMKLPLQSTTARPFEVLYFRIWSLRALTFADDVLLPVGRISQGAFGERIVRDLLIFIKEESQQDVRLIPGQIYFLSCGKLLITLFLYWYVFEYHFLVSKTFCWSNIYQHLQKQDFIMNVFCLFVFWFGCWLNLSLRLSSFSNKNLHSPDVGVRLVADCRCR